MKFRFWHFLFLCVIFLNSCTHTDKIQEFVNKSQSQLPVTMGNFGDVTNMFIDGKNVVLVALLDETNRSTDVFDSPKSLKVILENSLREGKMFDLLKTFIAEGYGLTFRYKGRKSGKTVDAHYTVSELKQIQLKGVISEKELNEIGLKRMVDNNNRYLPMSIDEFTTLKKLNVGYNLEIFYEIYEDEYVRVSDITEDLKGMKDIFFKEIQESKNETFVYFLALAIKAQKGLTISYMGCISKNSVNISYSNDELREYYNMYLSSVCPLLLK